MLLLCLVHEADLLAGLLDGAAQVFHVDGLHGEVEGPVVHRLTDIRHVAVGTYHDDVEGGIAYLVDLCQQGQTVHLGHVDVAEDDLYVGVKGEYVECLRAVVCEEELVFPVADLPSEVLFHQLFHSHLVVNAQYLDCIHSQFPFLFFHFSFLYREDILPSGIFIGNRVHHLGDEEDAQSADLTL